VAPAPPLTLSILQIVERFGRLPLGLLYRQVSASEEEVKQQLDVLVEQGAVKLEGDVVSLQRG
jgi:DNA-binding Lrp family transcriptional regulator